MSKSFRRLRGRIVEKFGTYAAFARAAGIKENSLSQRLSGQVGISFNEVVAWSALLDIDLGECCSFFLE